MYPKLSLSGFYFLLAALVIFGAGYARSADTLLPAAAAESLEEARKLCSSLSEQNKRLAKSAGYDLEKLCSSLELFAPIDGADQQEPLVLPRKELSEDETNDETDQQIPRPESIIVTDSDNLTLFGYDLFAGEPTTFEPASSIPVEPDYILGPGDNLRLQYYGKINESMELEVSRDGAVDLPQLGPINIAGLTFSEAKALLKRRISEERIGVEVSVSLGELRSIHVFVLGEAYKPGTYTVSAMSTITNVLFLSGGVSEIASLRNIQVKRDGNLVASLDLYDLLLKGDTSNDMRLQAGDAIYIPTVGRTASVQGEVRRPAVYELKGEINAQQLIDLSGGLQPKAFNKKSRIHRIDHSGFMTVVDIDLSTKAGKKTLIRSGDKLVIDPVAEHREMVVSLTGHVHHPGEFLWHQGIRVSDIVSNSQQLLPDADMGFALIRRELPPTGKIQPIFVDIESVLADSGSSYNLLLSPRDQLMIFSNRGSRAEVLAELVQELRLQSRSGEMAQVASITGTVRSPGEYPLTENMRLTQLIAAAGGLNEEAYTQFVELTRHDFTNIEQASSDHISVTLAEAYSNPAKDPVLSPYDVVAVRTIPEFRESLTITLSGELRFPGVYTFRRGETLTSVIRRAGGLTELAHSRAAVFTREDLREQESKQLAQLRQRLRSDLAASGLEQANEGRSADLEASKKLLAELDATQALGRLVVDLEAVLDGSLDDVTLKDGDLLVIPEFRQEVAVIGEIQHPSAHLYNRKLSIADYIKLSGGSNSRADNKRLYVVKADGSVSLPRRSGWFRKRGATIEPGDTIVLPLDVGKRRKLTVWSEVSTVIYQLALGAAAVNSF